MSVEQGIAQLGQPLAEANPCGEDLDLTSHLASLDAFRLFGQVSLLEPAPDWANLKATALEALDKSRDLRALAYLSAALIRTDGLAAFLATLGIVAQWLELFWDHVYPRVDEDAILRRSSINCFADRVAIVDGLRRAALVSHRQLGAVSLREIELAGGRSGLNGDSQTPDLAQVDAVFAATAIEDLLSLAGRIDEAVSAVRRIETAMVSRSGVEAAPSLEGLNSYLVSVQRAVRQHIAVHPNAARVAESNPPDSNTTVGDSAAAGQRVVAVGAIRSRQEALRALDEVAAFFRQNEPSSPVPLFIERAKRLVAKDFLEILADIVPEAIAQAKITSGVKDKE